VVKASSHSLRGTPFKKGNQKKKRGPPFGTRVPVGPSSTSVLVRGVGREVCWSTTAIHRYRGNFLRGRRSLKIERNDYWIYTGIAKTAHKRKGASDTKERKSYNTPDQVDRIKSHDSEHKREKTQEGQTQTGKALQISRENTGGNRNKGATWYRFNRTKRGKSTSSP